jgi:catechol 2,3-dioxygenase-like lactoylglutathione lyase family enzyme
MFSHIVVGSNDLQKSKTFYDAIFGVAGVGPGMQIDETRVAYIKPGAASFMVTRPINGNAATFANGGTIGFPFESPQQVDAWHAAGCANGGTTCEEPPGMRDRGMGKMYLAYLRDPDGNKLCAIHRPEA